MNMGRSAVVLVVVGLCAAVAHAGEIGSPASHDVYVASRTAAPPPNTTFTVGPGATLKDDPPPPVEPLDHDEFLGEVSSTIATGGLNESVDPFSGSLHIGATDVVLPGAGGVDIVIQRYYNSGAV